MKNDGQPVPLSYFVFEEKSGRSQPAQWNVPFRCSSFRGLVKARSVPSCRITQNWSGVRMRRHSASVFVISNTSSSACDARPASSQATPPARRNPRLVFISPSTNPV